MKNFLYNSDLGNFLFRLFVGLSMALAHGLGKVPPSDKFIEGVEGLGFPLPLAFAWGAGLTELLGGLLIASGLFTRWSALFLGFTMAVAAFGRHASDPFNVKEMALLYFFASVLIALQGAGKYSLDRIVRKK